jgi:hypothetical protein
VRIGQIHQKAGTIADTESLPQLTNMCELAFIEYNPTFDSIIPFPWFFDVTKKNFKVIFNNCHSLMTLMIGLYIFF